MIAFIAKLITTILAILVISKSYLSYRKRQEPLAVFLFWAITWLAIAGLSYFPQVIDYLIAPDKGVGLGTVFGVVITFLLFVVYRIYIKADRIEKNLTKLVSELAVKDLDSQ
jgi:hypothetical protein